MTRFELQPQRPRAEEAPAMQIGTPDPNVLDCVCPVLSSSGLISSPAPLEVFPVRSGFASSRFREVHSTSLPFLHESFQRKMRFRLHFVLLASGPQAHSATGGSAPQTDRPVEDQQCPLSAASCPDTCSLVFFSDRTAGDQLPCCAPDT